MYEKTGLFRVTCDYTIKAKTLKEVEDYVKEECGDFEFYERHIIITPIEIPIDVDLMKK